MSKLDVVRDCLRDVDGIFFDVEHDDGSRFNTLFPRGERTSELALVRANQNCAAIVFRQQRELVGHSRIDWNRGTCGFHAFDKLELDVRFRGDGQGCVLSRLRLNGRQSDAEVLLFIE